MNSIIWPPTGQGAKQPGTLADPATRAKADKRRGYMALSLQPSEQP